MSISPALDLTQLQKESLEIRYQTLPVQMV